MALGKKTGGRKKGTPNKTTLTLKEGILEAYEKSGGVEYLLGIAKKDPKTFCALLAKLIPSEVKADLTSSDGSMQPVRIELVSPNAQDSED